MMEDSTITSPEKNQVSKSTLHFLPRLRTTLLVLGICLLPFLFLWGAIFVLWVYAKFPEIPSVILGFISSSTLILLLRPVSGFLEKLLPTDSLKSKREAIWKNFCTLWQGAFHPTVTVTVTDLVMVVLSILLLFHYFYIWLDPYTGRGRLSLDDSLKNMNSVNRWGTNNQCDLKKGFLICTQCQLSSEGLQVSTNETGHFHFCIAQAADRYENFVYEVQMTIIAGDCGAMLFRAYPGRDTTYLYEVCRNGYFELRRYDSGMDSGYFGLPVCNLIKGRTEGSNCILSYGNVSDITEQQQQLVKPITLAVKADGTSIDLYVDHHRVGGYDDLPAQAYLKGFIGVAADARTSATEIIFSNAKVWQF